MPNFLRQTIAPEPFSTKSLSENHWRTIEVGKRYKPVFIVRYLLSKIVFSKEKLSELEAVALFVNFERVQETCIKEPVFNQKYGYEIFKFRAIFQSLNQILEQDPSERFQEMQECYRGMLRGNFISRRFYFSAKGTLQKDLDIRIRTRWPKRFPPRAFVGRGYGDHGTAKNKAYDGTPSWQEIAMNYDELSSQSVSIKTAGTECWRSLRVHPKQLHAQRKAIYGWQGTPNGEPRTVEKRTGDHSA